MVIILLLFCIVFTNLAAGQSITDPYEAMRTAMEASVEIQMQSVRRQLDSLLGNVAATSTSTVSSSPLPSAGTSIAPVAAVEPLEQDCTPIPTSMLRDYIKKIADREGLTPDLLRAVISRESSFNPCAVSSAGAQGMMQLMPLTAAQFDVNNPFDARQNIDAGARYHRQLLDRYDDITLALGAYNAGPTRIDTYRGLPPIPETLNYVSSIMEMLGMEALPTPATQ